MNWLDLALLGSIAAGALMGIWVGAIRAAFAAADQQCERAAICPGLLQAVDEPERLLHAPVGHQQLDAGGHVGKYDEPPAVRKLALDEELVVDGRVGALVAGHQQRGSFYLGERS